MAVWLIFIIGFAPLCAQKAELIGEKMVMFTPINFDGKAHLPSFALENEPQVIGEKPKEWQINVEFAEAFDRSIAYLPLDVNIDLYGTGEVTGPLLRNGTTRKLWNMDNYAYERDRGQKLYQSHPWVLGVRQDGTSFGVLADNTWRSEISLGEGITFTSDSKPFRVIVIERDTPQEVMQALAHLTGKMPLPPLWSLGFQQCRWSYFPDSRVREIADTLRYKEIPCDVIWMDIHYMDGYRVFTFSPQDFPDPKSTNDYLHSKGFKAVWMIDPGVKNEAGYQVFDSGEKENVWIKDKDGNNYVGNVWPGPCVFPDFTQPKTQKWWAGLYLDFMKTGIDGVWNDMNEPAVFNGFEMTMPRDNVHFGGGGLEKDIHLRYHNVYGMLMVKSSREGIMKVNPDKRPFILSRSNFLGGHRYAATWTGDNESTWEHLRMSIPMSINLGLSGQPFNGPDIGGFAENATPDLFGHWIAVGAFYPFCRAHSILDSKAHEPWAFGEKIESVSRIALNRRYRLMPYIYTKFYEASTTGLPVMQPLFFADLKDYDLRKEDQVFLLGGDLMVIPKWAENPVLPKGNWRTLSLVGEDSEKDQYQPDLKIRPGAIVPCSKVIQNTTEYSLENLDLYISLDEQGKASGSLYHDAGDGYGYKEGDFSLIRFTAELTGNKLIIRIGDQKGGRQLGVKKLIVHLVNDNKTVQRGVRFSKTMKIDL
ncbi:MAG: DUF5110 domain-containing protein [Candidatus Marinimicrobia bacterium]|nr:DUF5110 domain-containing protein [Candidatus Neomarinimicrobiota bacterium]